MFPSTSAVRPYVRRHVVPMTGFILAGLALILAAGCGSITAQGRNAEGVRLFQQGQYQTALREFQEATYTDPDNPDGYYNLAATFHRLGLVERQQSYLDQAENYYNQCLDRDPNHQECYRGLATLLAQQDRTDEAFRLLEGWVERQPGVADAKIELARLFEEFGRPAEAKEHLTEALAIDPNNARALAALGKLREDAGELVEAVRNYQHSLAYNRFQPQVAARVSALQASMAPALSAATIPGAGERVVEKESAPLR